MSLPYENATSGGADKEAWVCPWSICNREQAQACRAEMRQTKTKRGCGTLFPAGTTLEQAQRQIGMLPQIGGPT